MEPIPVPGPSKTAFDKNRRMSDLIKKQVEHFKHLEEKLPPEVRARVPQHRIVTENDAARYIAPMTQLLLERAAAPQAGKEQVGPVPMPQRGATKQKNAGVDLAAAAGPSPTAASAAKTQELPATPKKQSPGKSPGTGKRTK